VLLDLAACERRADFSRPCGARFTDLAAQVTVDERLADMREKAIGTRLGEMATGTWDKLEKVFEDRVGGALHALNVPTRKDIDGLSKQVHELTIRRNAASRPELSRAAVPLAAFSIRVKSQRKSRAHRFIPS